MVWQYIISLVYSKINTNKKEEGNATEEGGKQQNKSGDIINHFTMANDDESESDSGPDEVVNDDGGSRDRAQGELSEERRKRTVTQISN